MKRIIVSLLALLFIISYSYAQDTLKYSETDSDIEVNAGDNIVITLESNQITGFKWRLAKPLDSKILELIDVQYVLGMARFLGEGGKEVWNLKALVPGKAVISLEYIRPWENNSVPMKQKEFEVTVKSPIPQENP